MSEINLCDLMSERECTQDERDFFARQIMCRLPDFIELFHYDTETDEKYESDTWVDDNKVTIFINRVSELEETWLGLRFTRLIVDDGEENDLTIFPNEDVYEYSVELNSLKALCSQEVYLNESDEYKSEFRPMTAQDLQNALLHLEEIESLRPIRRDEFKA